MASQWLASTKDAITKTMSQLQENLDARSPPPKSARKGEIVREGSPPPRAQASTQSWYQEALNASLSTYAGGVDDRFQAVESRVTTMEVEVKAADGNAKHAVTTAAGATAAAEQAARDLQEMKAKMEQMEATLKAVQAPLEGQAKAVVEQAVVTALEEKIGTGQMPKVEDVVKATQELANAKTEAENARRAVPLGAQAPTVTATLGSLGWDLSEQEALDKAREVLDRAHINPATWSNLSTERENRLSNVMMEFGNAKQLLDASKMVRSAQIRMPGATSNAWIDVKKTPEQLRPGRWCRRAERWMKNALMNHPETLEVQADMRKKVLIVRGQEIGAPGKADWIWWPNARTFLTDNELDVGAAWIIM